MAGSTDFNDVTPEPTISLPNVEGHQVTLERVKKKDLKIEKSSVETKKKQNITEIITDEIVGKATFSSEK